MKRRTYMAVDAEGDGDGGVTEAFLDDPWVDALLQSQCCPGVAESVESNSRQAGRKGSAKEHVADCVGVEPFAVGLVEDETTVFEVGADEETFFEHAFAMLSKYGDSGTVERD